eukprot:6170699-Pleurochrysis_carterae.AAC.5
MCGAPAFTACRDVVLKSDSLGASGLQAPRAPPAMAEAPQRAAEQADRTEVIIVRARSHKPRLRDEGCNFYAK